MKLAYTLTKITLDENICKGVYTKKTTLFKKIKSIHENNTKIFFTKIIKFENKKFNYMNLLELLNYIEVDDYFFINFVVNNNIVIYEIKKLEINK